MAALVFLYRHVLSRELGLLQGLAWAKRSEHVRTVLTREEVVTVLAELSEAVWLIAALLYGAGLRLTECLELRVKAIEFDSRTPLPVSLIEALVGHLDEVRRLHARDLASGLGRVMLPAALAAKYPGAAQEWRWQFACPAGRICRDPRWGQPSSTRTIKSTRQCSRSTRSSTWAGALPLPQRRLVEAWAEIHSAELQADWDLRLLQSGRPPVKIDPLR